MAALHRAASEWYAAHGFLREAVQHAFQTTDWEYAATLVEQHCFTLIMHSDIATIYEWCSAFPEEVMQTHPLLCLHQCWAWVFSFRRQNRSRIEARLQQVAQAVAFIEDAQVVRMLTEQAAVIQSFLKMAPDPAVDPRAELIFAQRMLDSYPADDPGRFSTLLTTAYIHLALHDAQSAREAFETARQIALTVHLYFGIAESTFQSGASGAQSGTGRAARWRSAGKDRPTLPLCCLIPSKTCPPWAAWTSRWAACCWNRINWLRPNNIYCADLNLIGGGLNPNYLFTACVALFRLCEIQGRSAEALTYLARLEEMWPDVAFCTRGPAGRTGFASGAAGFNHTRGSSGLVPGFLLFDERGSFAARHGTVWRG